MRPRPQIVKKNSPAENRRRNCPADAIVTEHVHTSGGRSGACQLRTGIFRAGHGVRNSSLTALRGESSPRPGGVAHDDSVTTLPVAARFGIARLIATAP